MNGAEPHVWWSWLLAQEPVTRKTYTRHLRFDQPLVVKMNGRTHEGVIFRPGKGG